MKKSFLTFYGNVTLERGICPVCKSTALIQNKKYACCDLPVESKPRGFKRVSEPEQHRNIPSKVEREKMLAEQEHSCFYCGISFGSVRHRKGKSVIIKLCWDHKLPYSFTQNNHSHNFVAACNVCNSIKSDKIFRDLQEAQIYIQSMRRQKGFDF